MRFLSRVSKLGCTRILTRALALLFALGVFATAADARGFRLGGLGLNERIEKVYDLPRIDDLKLPDGRYIDIGRIYGGSNDRKLIGYAGSSSEYLNLPSEVMADLVKVAGFSSIAAFEEHLAAEQKAKLEQRKAEAEEKRERAAAAREERRQLAASRVEAGQNGTAKHADDGAWGSNSVDQARVVPMPVLWVVWLILGFLPYLLVGIVVYGLYRVFRPRRQAAPARDDQASVDDMARELEFLRAANASAQSPGDARAAQDGAAAVAALQGGQRPIVITSSDGSAQPMGLDTENAAGGRDAGMRQLAAVLGKSEPAPKSPPPASTPPRRPARTTPIAGARASFGKK